MVAWYVAFPDLEVQVEDMIVDAKLDGATARAPAVPALALRPFEAQVGPVDLSNTCTRRSRVLPLSCRGMDGYVFI